jgi:hypothetical protein
MRIDVQLPYKQAHDELPDGICYLCFWPEEQKILHFLAENGLMKALNSPVISGLAIRPYSRLVDASSHVFPASHIIEFAEQHPCEAYAFISCNTGTAALLMQNILSASVGDESFIVGDQYPSPTVFVHENHESLELFADRRRVIGAARRFMAMDNNKESI